MSIGPANPPSFTPEADLRECPGEAFFGPVLSALEPFYLNNGARAAMFAFRHWDGTVDFAYLRFDAENRTYERVVNNFEFIGESGYWESIPFTSKTNFVEFLQIDNKILALSDAGEPARLFDVGLRKTVKRLKGINVPEWTDADKLMVRHPEAAWIDEQASTKRTNVLLNSSFELGTAFWTPSERCGMNVNIISYLNGLGQKQELELFLKPLRQNLLPPLDWYWDDWPTNTRPYFYDWRTHPNYGSPVLTVEDYPAEGDLGTLVITAAADGQFLALTTQQLQFPGNIPQGAYRFALDLKNKDSTAAAQVQVVSYALNGSMIGDPLVFDLPNVDGRYVLENPFTFPEGTTTFRFFVGGTGPAGSQVRVAYMILCRAEEPTDYIEWSYSPDSDIWITSQRVGVMAGLALAAQIQAKAYASLQKYGDLTVTLFDKQGAVVTSFSGNSLPLPTSYGKVTAVSGGIPGNAVSAELEFRIFDMSYGDQAVVDEAMLEPGVAAAGTYFDGSTPNTANAINEWTVPTSPHASASQQTLVPSGLAIPGAETPTTKTVIAAGGAEMNPYKIGLFYTFSNEVGESAASRITEVRVCRPRSNWYWETPNTEGEPSGVATEVAELCADQLVVIIPQQVYEQAIREGAIKWSLYALDWSDQEPVPVVGVKIHEQALYPEEGVGTYQEAGWAAITPARKVGLDDAPLPSIGNRVNYSKPPTGRTGLVVADRMIVVGAPEDPATVRWSSNRFGDYTNFTANVGGGQKTLTTGNLSLPARAVLWQNPQSVDTITILCMATDERAGSYYMTPASIDSQSGGKTAVMGFEETSNTPGTVSPHGAQVMNNALYRALDQGLMKSTAANYNINHKMVTDPIANMWNALHHKERIVVEQLDNRIYVLVHNPYGEPLEDGCRGNEIWVLDNGIESGPWMRWTVQATHLFPVEVADVTYMAIAHPDGIFYFDPEYRVDDYVPKFDNRVWQRPIPFSFQTNTQGANRAHDAWAHLQQVEITLGGFAGSLRYGVRGLDVNGRQVDVSKVVTDNRPLPDHRLLWDLHDPLQVRRDLKEWVFYVESVPGKVGTGRVCHVQYRYTPVSVNVGYEYGSVETFEYGRSPDVYAENAVPRPYVDYRRP